MKSSDNLQQVSRQNGLDENPNKIYLLLVAWWKDQ